MPTKDAYSPNPLAGQAWSTLSAKYPHWSSYVTFADEGDLEVAVPAPPGSNAGHLVIFTSGGKDLWVRFNPPLACYPIDDEAEMLEIVRQIQAEQALLTIVTQNNEWIETTLIRPGEQPELRPGQIARVISWSGKNDFTVGDKNKM